MQLLLSFVTLGRRLSRLSEIGFILASILEPSSSWRPSWGTIAGNVISDAGTGTSIGASVGSMIKPGVGTAVGAKLGAVHDRGRFLDGNGFSNLCVRISLAHPWQAQEPSPVAALLAGGIT